MTFSIFHLLTTNYLPNFAKFARLNFKYRTYSKDGTGCRPIFENVAQNKNVKFVVVDD